MFFQKRSHFLFKELIASMDCWNSFIVPTQVRPRSTGMLFYSSTSYLISSSNCLISANFFFNYQFLFLNWMSSSWQVMFTILLENFFTIQTWTFFISIQIIMDSSSSFTRPASVRIITHSRQSSRMSCDESEVPRKRKNSQMRTSFMYDKQKSDQYDLQKDLLQTQRSTFSKQSFRSRRDSTYSKSSWNLDLDEFLYMNVSQLTELLDNLLCLRLDFMRDSENSDLNIMYDINRKLELIKKAIIAKNKEELKPEQLELISVKIQMIDKILAQNWVQSELIKKKFNASISHPTSKKYGDYERRASCAKLKQFMNNPIQKLETTTVASPQKSITVESRYKSSYQSPNADLIKLYKIPKKKYISNNAPTPSSIYQSQYYDYKNYSKPSVHENNSPTLSLGYHKKQFKTNYNSEYLPRVQAMQDYRQLDCYKNKIRDLKLRFISKSLGPTEEQLKQSVKNLAMPFLSSSKANLNLNPSKMYEGQYLSSSKNDYKLPSLFSKIKPKYEGFQKKKMDLKFSSYKSKSKYKNNLTNLRV